VAIAHRDRPLPALPASLPTEVVEFVMVLTAKDPVWQARICARAVCSMPESNPRSRTGCAPPPRAGPGHP